MTGHTFEPVVEWSALCKVCRTYHLKDEEPPPGSVVLTHGPSGTAWQRWFHDSLWHSTTGNTCTWDELLEIGHQPLMVVYTPEENA